MKKAPLFLSLLLLIFGILSSFDVSAQSAVLRRGHEAFEDFRISDAIELYQQVLKKDKKNKEAITNIAHCYRLTSNYSKAAFYYKKAVRYNRDVAELKLYYGQSLMSNGKYEDAAEQFDQFILQKPYDSRGYNFLDYCQNIEEYKKDSSSYIISPHPTNSDDSDFGPTFFQGGLVFASGRASQLIDRKSQWNDESYVSIFYSAKEGYGWSEAEPLTGLTKAPYHEGPAVFSKNGRKMYFTRNVGKQSGKKSGTVTLKIYEARWDGSKWSNITELPFNSNNYSVGHPALSPDGRKLYFTSDQPGGRGGKDLYVSEFKNGKWQKGKNLGKSINTEGDEMFPTMMPDGSLYFSSNGLGGFGGLDLFQAEEYLGSWTVTNVGYPINSPKDDMGLILTDDKRLGYFASNRKGGKGGDDIYMLSINEVKAQEMVIVDPLQPSTPPELDIPIVNVDPEIVEEFDQKEPEFQEAEIADATPPAKQEKILKPIKKEVPSKAVKEQKVKKEKAPKRVKTPKQPKAKKEKKPKVDPTPTVSEPQIAEAIKDSQPEIKNTTAPIVEETPKVDSESRKPVSDFSGPKQSVSSSAPATITKPWVNNAPTSASNPKPNTSTSSSSSKQTFNLIGIVLDEFSKKPFKKAEVTLEELGSGKQRKFVTRDDGNFYFKLEGQKKYELKKIDKNGNIEDSKMVSTIEKSDSEVMYYILLGSTHQNAEEYLKSAKSTKVNSSIEPKKSFAPGTSSNPKPTVQNTVKPAPKTSVPSSTGTVTPSVPETKKSALKTFRLVLIGIAIEEKSKGPINRAVIELEDLMTKRIYRYITQKDGNFYFNLEAGRQYYLKKVNDKGVVEDVKLISTMDKTEPEVLYSIVKGAADPRFNNPITGDQPVYTGVQSKSTSISSPAVKRQ